MPAKANTVKSTDLTWARTMDFVTRFKLEIKVLNDLFSAMRLEKHEAGTQLKAKKANVTLNTTAVGEGEEIPYNAVSYTETPIGSLAWDKQSIGISLETLAKHGYDAAVQDADNDMLYKLRSKLVTNFVNFLQTGTLTTTRTITTFQDAVAEAAGQVENQWEQMDKGFSDMVGFCNTLDVYRTLGAANITTQTDFGLTYIKDYLGFQKLFFSSKIPSGRVVATPSENVVLYYADVTDSDYAKAGFEFTTDGDKNLIGVHVEGNHRTMVSEITTITGMGLFAEFLNGIAVIDFTPIGA